MALFYITQGYREKLNAKAATSGAVRLRASDLRAAVFGSNRKSSELTYLRAQNTDAAGVNTKFSNAWTKFGVANGAAGTRSDQIFHDFQTNGTYP